MEGAGRPVTRGFQETNDREESVLSLPVLNWRVKIQTLTTCSYKRSSHGKTPKVTINVYNTLNEFEVAQGNL